MICELVLDYMCCFPMCISPLQLSMPFPPGGLVYDYRLDDGGVSKVGKGDEEEEEDKTKFKVILL